MEQRGSILLLGDRDFQTGPWLKTAQAVSTEVAGAEIPNSIESSASVDVVITNLSFSVPLDEAFKALKEGNGERVLVVALPQNSPYTPQELAEHGAHFIFSDSEFPARAASVLHEALRRVRPRKGTLDGVLETKFQFRAQDYREEFRKLAILDSIEALCLIDRKDRLRLLLAYQEALTNALEHGCLELDSRLKDVFDNEGQDSFSLSRKNKLRDPNFNQRRVFVEAKWENEEIQICIEDEGKGFLQTEQTEANSLKLYGRGIGLLNSLMDTVVYSKHGKKLVMGKSFKKHGS